MTESPGLEFSSSRRFEKKQHANLYSICVILFISISSAAYGYAGSVIATTLTQPSFQEYMGLKTAPNAESLIGAMNALFYAGGVFGAFFAGYISSRFGRKWSATLGNLQLLIAGALLCGSVNPAMFIVSRFISGSGSFTILASVPLWVAELAPPMIRGICVDIHAVGMMVGYTLACYTGLGFYFVSGSNQWRGPLGLQMALPAIILCGIYWMPESPRFLLSKGRIDDAWGIVVRMHSSPSDPDNEFPRLEFYQMRKQTELDKTFETSYIELIRKPSLRKRAIMTVFLQFSLMSSGILVILNYGSIIWASLGFKTVQILNFQGGFQLTGFVFNVVAMTFVDKMKRNWLMTLGFSLSTIIMLCEALLQKYFLNTTNTSGLAACAAMIFLFQANFSLFLDGPTYFYVAEIWPSYVRSQGFALGMATLSLTNLMWLQAAPHAFAAIHWKFYLFFIIIPATAAVVIFFFFPDTLHKPLEEIAAMFGDTDEVAVYQEDLDLEKIKTERSTKCASPKKEASSDIIQGTSEEFETAT